MSNKLIQQQLYTRERGGIFNTTDGFDTIAISPNLDKTFLKKYIHPICLYHTPNSLKASGAKDTSLYPKAITLIQPESGDLIMGQSVFTPTDFTGQRSAFFMHNYLIPRDRKEEWLRSPEKLFGIDQFQTSYDIQLGQELPELTNLSYAENRVPNSIDFLNRLGITEVIFKQLLYAVMTSISGKKKVFITLDVALQDYTNYATQLLELLFHYLPYSYRRKMGAVTYSNEAEGKKYIHITFVEPGCINYNDRFVEKQYIFDLANKRISGVELGGQIHEYLNLAWNFLAYSKSMDEFFEFAEKALLGHDGEVALDIANYYLLTDLFWTKKLGGIKHYEKNKIAFLRGLLKFIQKETEAKSELINLFMKLVLHEGYPKEEDTVLDFIGILIEFNKIVPNDDCFTAILNTLKHYHHSPLFMEIWNTVEQDEESLHHTVEKINDSPDNRFILLTYLEAKFTDTDRLDDVLNKIKKLLISCHLFLKNEAFISLSAKNIAYAVKNSDKPFDAAVKVKGFSFDSLDSLEFIQYKNTLISKSENALLSTIDLENITKEDINHFGRFFLRNTNFIKSGMEYVNTTDSYQIMEVLYSLFNSSGNEERQISLLSDLNQIKVQAILKRLLQRDINAQNYTLLLLAFYDAIYHKYHYQKLFDFIRKNGNNKLLISFIKWANKYKQHDQDFYQQLQDYLIINNNKVWKDTTFRKSFKNIRSDRLHQVYRYVKKKNASPFVKFMKSYGLLILLFFMSTGVIGVVLWYILNK